MNHQYISEGTMQYLLQQYPDHTPAWLDAFDGEVRRLEEKWRLTIRGHERDSRFGAILYGSSEVYGEVAMKIVPWFSPRLQGETYCYRRLPYRELCPLYDVDEKLGAMLLRYVAPVHSASDAPKERTIAAMYAQRRLADAQDAVLPLYRDVLAEVASIAQGEIERTGDAGYRLLTPSIERARKAIAEFATQPLYAIHGDAHGFNLLEEGGHCVLIDPLGYRAPFAFEWARYLGTAMKETDIPQEDFAALVRRLSQDHAPLEEVLCAFAIDTTLRACNTFIEGNTHEEICFGAEWARRAWAYCDALREA